MLLRSNFSSFPQYFRYICNFKSLITHIFVICGKSNYFFLNSANLICRGMDISKNFRESLGIRDNESRLYLTTGQKRHISACATVLFDQSLLSTKRCLNPLMPSGHFYLNVLDRSISYIWGVWLVFIIIMH